MRKEPTFIQKIHEEREADTRILYEQFHGDVAAWLHWMERGDQKDRPENHDRQSYQVRPTRIPQAA